MTIIFWEESKIAHHLCVSAPPRELFAVEPEHLTPSQVSVFRLVRLAGRFCFDAERVYARLQFLG
jgi:hypothetical protein